MYLNRQTAPSGNLTYGSDPIRGAGIAIDPNGNCYWSFNDPYTFNRIDRGVRRLQRNGHALCDRHLEGRAAWPSTTTATCTTWTNCWASLNARAARCTLFVPIVLGGLIEPANINFDRSNPQSLWVADAGGYIDAINLQGLVAYLLQIIRRSDRSPDRNRAGAR